jgi:hypothetical protein
MSQTTLRRNESGLAAITVTLIILGIVTLITVGFATLMRREQRQALDQQLSTQAFYAAESGVNVAREYIDSVNATDPDALTDVDTCDSAPSQVTSQSSVGANVSFTCVLMDVTPDELERDLTPEKSWVVRVQTANGAPIENLEVSWAMPGSTVFAPDAWSQTNLLLPDSKWSVDISGQPAPVTGLMRLMLIPNTTNKTDLINNTYQAFLYPNQSANPSSLTTQAVSATPSRLDQGKFLNGNCNQGKTPRYCKVRLTGLGGNTYYLRLKSIYSPATVSVRSFDDDNQPQELRNGQAKIDSTGKAADVVRRIQVNVPLTSADYTFPEYAVETFSTLCKRFIVWPGGAQADVDSSNGTLAISNAQRNACNP